MKVIATEKYIEKLGADVYPITIVKFLLNKKRILSYFKRVIENKQIEEEALNLDTVNCNDCLKNREQNILCRPHTSIHRVLDSENVAIDLDTNTYFYKNEIFKMIGNKLAIVYCPHTKLITNSITDSKIRKVNTSLFIDEKIQLPVFKTVNEFLSTTLLEQHMKCWFNDDFSIITIPNDRNYSNYCLVPNKKENQTKGGFN